ncbi:hypothetical protein H8R18_01270 [Nanchangia anserum]|uniref:Uncharacterized protein n=1 Tax=Nanchangia anserum TaxID=2692125 RepID=A0A8I0G8K5_9ACTO|nr:hypothetical protein [Nanchangia anserum]MBD3689867.1 hypothetical protein [Nanchangia anserum]QOX82035.1 hypothetical protein H8R18_01270 [Nanchangia anserum]
MDAQLAAEVQSTLVKARKWWHSEGATAQDQRAALAGYIRDHVAVGPAHRAENAALNYLVKHRAGTPYTLTTPTAVAITPEEISYHIGATAAALEEFADRPDRFLRELDAIISRLIMTRARQTVRVNAARIGAKYARIPEAGACYWCLMLASRGAVYESIEKAQRNSTGDSYHPHCRCSVGEVHSDALSSLPTRTRKCVQFRKKFKPTGYEGWRALVASGQFTETTGITSTTRLEAIARELKARNRAKAAEGLALAEDFKKSLSEVAAGRGGGRLVETVTRFRPGVLSGDQLRDVFASLGEVPRGPGTPIHRLFTSGEGPAPREWFDFVRHDPTRLDRLGPHRVQAGFAPVVWDDLELPETGAPEPTWENLYVNAYGKWEKRRKQWRLYGGHLVMPAPPDGANLVLTKSICPPGWTEDDLTVAAFLSLDDPQWRINGTPRHADRRVLRREMYGVIFEHAYYIREDGAGQDFAHCMPLCGDTVRATQPGAWAPFDLKALTTRDKIEWQYEHHG